MTTKDDWDFRADHLTQAAEFHEAQARCCESEAQRYRGLAEQARMLGRLGYGEGWQTIDSAPKGKPIQVGSDDKEHNWLPFTACLEFDRWTRPASRDDVPYQPTHWRELPTSPYPQS